VLLGPLGVFDASADIIAERLWASDGVVV
jgi:hypothetical protein